MIYVFRNERFARIHAESEDEARAILKTLLQQREEDMTQWKLLYTVSTDGSLSYMGSSD
jgi:plasmid stability protein